MVGYVGNAIAKALREWPALKEANVMPVRAVNGASVVVNTPLPAIAVHINGTDGQGNTYLGGGIRQFFDLELWYLCDVPNFAFSPDVGHQAQQLDLSDEIIRCMELSPLLDGLKTEHDFNGQFDRMETDQTYGTKGALSVTIDVHKIIYSCDVQFDPHSEGYERYVELKKVIINDKLVIE